MGDETSSCSRSVSWTAGQAPVAGETWTVAATGLKASGGTSCNRIWTITVGDLARRRSPGLGGAGPEQVLATRVTDRTQGTA